MTFRSRRIGACLAAMSLALPACASAFETGATNALAVDHATGLVLFEKDADQPIPPASMSKLMTLYMLFEAIRDERVTLETRFSVSPAAQAMGGSRMFVEAGTEVPVADLIRGIIVQSGNDACVVVAEGLAGTETAFAASMTKRAVELGLEDTTLKNASGWPEEGHVMSARDLVLLSRRIIDEFPDFYEYFKETEFTWNGITQPNRNPLLTLGIGADGLKTGHTSEAGFGLVGSAVQDDQRIVFMVSGLDSSTTRASETEALVKWGFTAFETIKFFTEGDVVTDAEVWLGEAPSVPLVAPANLQMLVPQDALNAVSARIVYDGPIEAPIALGAPVARLVVEVPGHETVGFDLVAGAQIARGGLLTRVSAAARLTRDRAMALIPGRD